MGFFIELIRPPVVPRKALHVRVQRTEIKQKGNKSDLAYFTGF